MKEIIMYRTVLYARKVAEKYPNGHSERKRLSKMIGDFNEGEHCQPFGVKDYTYSILK